MIRGMKEYQKALKELPKVIHRGAINGLHEALDDLLRRARGIAPKDIGFLKAEMRTEIDTALMEGSLLSNAYSEGFNYAYYLHEVASKKGYKARNGGSLTWLSDAFDEERAKAIIDAEIEKALKEAGW